MARVSEAWEEMFHKKTIKKNPVIWCYKGGHESGFIDTDLILLRGDYSLNCKVCGKVCVRGLGKQVVSQVDEKVLKDALKNLTIGELKGVVK